MPLTLQRLLDQRAHVGQAALALGGDALALAPDAAREPDEERQQREAEGGQAPVEREHATIVGQDRGDVGDDRGRRRGDDVLHAADVVGDARLHLAGARAREEGQRQALQVAVDRGAQVVHHALADQVRQPRLRHAERPGGDRDGDHAGHQHRQQRGVALGDRVVEHRAQQEGRDHAQPRREADEREHDRQRAR
jgi:hypothetical protein